MHLGFDIGGTTARWAIFDDAWERVAEGSQRIRDRRAPDDLLEAVVEMTREAAAASDSPLETVGIGLAAQLDRDGTTVRNSPNLGWRDEPFGTAVQQALAEEFEAPPSFRLVNDVTAVLAGERLAGAVQGVDDILAVYVGTGVGGASASGGELQFGSGGNAGEIGHSKVEAAGRICGCGERGCLEAYAGGIHLEERVAGLIESGEVDALASGASLSEADAVASEFDALDALWREATDALALIIANACTLMDPAVLLLGGGVFEHCPDFRSRTVRKVPSQVLEVVRTDLEIRRPALGDRAGPLGAAQIASGG
jgi:glucokinase